MSQEWVTQRERGNLFWLRVITGIARHIGRPVARLLLYPITLYFFLTNPVTRRASREFLTLALSHKPTPADVFRHHRMFASTILDRVFLLTGREHLMDVHYHIDNSVYEYQAQGQGCLLLGSHLGSFEILRTLGARKRNLRLRVLMYEEHNEGITQFLHALNPEIADLVIPLGHPDSMLKVQECIESGISVAVLGDRVSKNDKLATCEFFGRQARFPISPALLGTVLQAPIYLFYGIYQGGRRYDIHVELLARPRPTKRSELMEVCQELTCRYARNLEQHARSAPYNWFNFYDYWEKT